MIYDLVQVVRYVVQTQDVSTSPVVTLVVVQMVFKWKVGNVGTLTSAQLTQLVVRFRSVFKVWNFQCNLFKIVGLRQQTWNI